MQPPNRRRSLNDLLNDLAETVERLEDEADCEEAREVLADYIGLELDGEDASSTYPTVARHLQICPSCVQHYQNLRILLLPSEDLVVEPPQPFDMRLLQPSQMLNLSPHDVVPPPQPSPAAPNSPLVAWLRAHPAGLQVLRASATSGASRLRSESPASAPEAVYAYERDIQELGDHGKIEFTPSQESGRAYFRGRLYPWENLRGKQLRLYTLLSDPELQLNLVQEVTIGTLGRIRITDLEPESYILTLVRDGGEDLPLVLINADEWEEEQPA